MSGIVPARLAASFTQGELGVLSVIERECRRGGSCTLPIGAIAALAGCCERLVQLALSQARRLGLLLVKEHRIPGRKSLTNIVTVVLRDWAAWLRFGGRGDRAKKIRPTDTWILFRDRQRRSTA